MNQNETEVPLVSAGCEHEVYDVCLGAWLQLAFLVSAVGLTVAAFIASASRSLPHG